ncbi:MAG: hypothetical protein WCI73_15805 [Phycisphaerae bacterium]
MSYDLERTLRSLPLRKPSAVLEARMAALWAQPAQRRWPWWGAAAAVLLVAASGAGWRMLAGHHVGNGGPTEPVQPPTLAVAVETERPGDALAQVLLEGRARGLTVRQTTRQWTDTGEALDTPVGPVRAYRAQEVEDVLWIDPVSGARVAVQQPQEAIVWVWQAVY